MLVQVAPALVPSATLPSSHNFRPRRTASTIARKADVARSSTRGPSRVCPDNPRTAVPGKLNARSRDPASFSPPTLCSPPMDAQATYDSIQVSLRTLTSGEHSTPRLRLFADFVKYAVPNVERLEDLLATVRLRMYTILVDVVNAAEKGDPPTNQLVRRQSRPLFAFSLVLTICSQAADLSNICNLVVRSLCASSIDTCSSFASNQTTKEAYRHGRVSMTPGECAELSRRASEVKMVCSVRPSCSCWPRAHTSGLDVQKLDGAQHSLGSSSNLCRLGYRQRRIYGLSEADLRQTWL